MARLRVFVMHNHLSAATGHPYTESLGWRRLCAARGISLEIFASLWADPQVLADTGARPLFGLTVESFGRFMNLEEARAPTSPELAPLQDFMLVSYDTARSCREAWAEAVEKPNLVIFPWATAATLNGVAEWLADVDPAARPRLVFNIVRPEPSWVIDGDRREVSGDFTWFVFASRRLRSLARPGGLVFTAVEPRLSALVGKVGQVDCRPAPLHKFYPAEADLAALRPADRQAGVSIGVLGPSHTFEKGWALLPEVIALVCAARAEASFFVQVEDRAQGETLSGALHAAGAPVRVTLHPGPLPTEDYFRRVLASDLILMPYDSPVYALMPSGIFADAVVCGTPVVAPAHTWISDRLDEGWGAGVAFSAPGPERIAEAVLAAIGDLGALRAKAAGRGEAWRMMQSLEAYVDNIMARLDFNEA